jgi:hypothetical protein
MSDKEYEVGYKKPPIEHRFQKGHKGGNRKGRAGGSVNLRTDLQAEMAERITLNENGKAIRLTKQRALVKSLIIKGIKGDDRAAGKALDLLLRLVGMDDPGDTQARFSPEDEAILTDYLARGRKGDD